ncbi:MAG: LysR family transcriptional regulator [Eggerthellaceae bacterium]|nr:LysR family transcriptional regulator [Eggerthellaceae bacterium]
MTLKQLEYFMEVARCLSFSAAAANLFISQSALSRSIAALEAELGALLFLRDRHTVTLTPAGAILAAGLPPLAEDLNRTVDLVKQVKEGMRGRLSLGIEEGLGLPVEVVAAVTYCRASMPFVVFEITAMDGRHLEESLANGRIDFALGYRLDEDAPVAGAGCLELQCCPLCVAAGMKSRLEDAPALSALNRQTFVFPASGAEAMRRWEAFCRANGIAPRRRECPDFATCVNAIELGLGVGLFPASGKAFDSPYVKRVALEQEIAARTLLQWNPASLNPIVGVFVGLIEGDL